MTEPPQPPPPPRPTTQAQSVLTQRPRARAHRCMENRQPPSSTVPAEENASNLMDHALPVCSSLRKKRRIDLFSLAGNKISELQYLPTDTFSTPPIQPRLVFVFFLKNAASRHWRYFGRAVDSWAVSTVSVGGLSPL